MMEYKVKILPQAWHMLLEITRYIRDELGEPGSAEAFMSIMQENIAALNAMPNRCSVTPEEPWRSRGVRRLLVKNWFVYYLVDEHLKKVDVIAVLYARSDLPARLADLDNIL